MGLAYKTLSLCGWITIPFKKNKALERKFWVIRGKRLNAVY